MLSFWILTGLLLKHFVVDFPLQANPWMYKNKGTYGHPGGITHAYLHGLGSLMVLMYLVPNAVAWLAAGVFFFDMILHYHIDWAKMNIGARFNLKPDNSEWFWILLGIDQLLHYMTYVVIAWAVPILA